MLKRGALAGLIIISVILSYGHYEINQPAHSLCYFECQIAQVPVFETSYSAESESLAVWIKTSKIPRENGVVAFKSMNSDTNTTNLTLIGYGKKKNTHKWSERSYLGLNLNKNDLTNFPIQPQQPIVIAEDGTDTDNDSNKGIENGETIAIYSKAKNQNKEMHRFRIRNNTAVTYKNTVLGFKPVN
ncbi:MAG: hypothetical protein BRC30_03420 [Nanohaloarchaea archaeon SW_7_46_7]|nr:MAG: hypothetical protein BRC30_03420 [Nanohaloarchaea archaeon SW_7_46_7]